MKINIVSDSSIDLFNLDNLNPDISFSTVPFIINIDDKEFIDDKNIDIDEFLKQMENSKTASRSSCPTTQSWYEEFKKEGNTIALTISSNLSGSFNAALSAKEMIKEEYPDKKIEIINSYSTGPAMEIIVEMISELLSLGKSFDEIVNEINKRTRAIKTIFTLSSFENLVKNGRMSRIAGFIAGKIGLWGVGIASKEGTIDIKGVILGSKRVLKGIVKDIEKRSKNVSEVVIHYVKNKELALALESLINETFPNTKTSVKECRALCSYYAERNGLIVSYR